jgi:hypothetical protein
LLYWEIGHDILLRQSAEGWGTGLIVPGFGEGAHVFLSAKLKEVKEQLQRRWCRSIPDQGRWLKQVVTGHFAYYAVPTNSRALSAFRRHVIDLWRRAVAGLTSCTAFRR